VNLLNFFAELKRRHVYRAAVAYAMVAWLLTQIATQVFPFFDIPNSAVRLVIIALVLGFPIAMTLAWIYEFTGVGFVRDEQVDPTTRKSAGRMIDFLIIGVLLLIIALLTFGRPLIRSSSGELIPEKSIAVLPFANFSDEKQNAFFADGVQDDILTALARISDLRVISRSSVIQFRDQTKYTLRDIGKLLGVANILEGSVRREGDKVVVNVQLIDALKDRHLWAKRYERTLADSLGLQGELASMIADELRVTLSPNEKAQIETKPTENADAYLVYLEANQVERNPDTLLEDYKKAEQLFMKAIALDPKFALAHARLASTRAARFHYYDPLESLKTEARREAEIALELQPNLAEAHLALGQCSYWTDLDYDRALAEFDTALRLAPNNTESAVLIAAIKRRQGKWQEALDSYQRITKLDPQNPNVVRTLLYTVMALRRWPESAELVARMRKLAPASIVAKAQSGYVYFWWKGDMGPLKSVISEIPANVDPDGVVTTCRWDIAMIERDFATAKRVMEESPLDKFSYTNANLAPKSFFLGYTALAQGDLNNARQLLDAARPSFEKDVAESPDSAERHANLGLVYALMGRKEDAIREGRRAVELKPESVDALDGVLMNCYLALIYARCGEKELAFPLLERLLKTPGAVDSGFYSVTVNDLKFRWDWDPIRNDPRFQKLISMTP
jgi:TolB-like protein/Tfp pilus assembly protein PilF